MTEHEYKTKKMKMMHKVLPKGFALMAYIGAAIYFIQQSNGGFWQVILGLLQAAVWPVYVVYHVLHLFGA